MTPALCRATLDFSRFGLNKSRLDQILTTPPPLNMSVFLFFSRRRWILLFLSHRERARLPRLVSAEFMRKQTRGTACYSGWRPPPPGFWLRSTGEACSVFAERCYQQRDRDETHIPHISLRSMINLPPQKLIRLVWITCRCYKIK